MADDKNSLDWIKANQSYSVGMAQIQQQANAIEADVRKENFKETVREDELTIKGVQDMARNMGFRVHYQRVNITTPEGKAYYQKLMSKFTTLVSKGMRNASTWYDGASPEERSAYWQSMDARNKSKNYAGSLNLRLPNKFLGETAPQGGVSGQYGSSDGEQKSVAEQVMSQVQAIRAANWFSPDGAPLVFPIPERSYSSGAKDIKFYQTPKSWK